MCNHEHIVVAHYGVPIDGAIGDKAVCDVSCADCKKRLFRSNSVEINIAYDYIDKNRSNFKTLVDLTCDNLNERYNIEDGLQRVK